MNLNKNLGILIIAIIVGIFILYFSDLNIFNTVYCHGGDEPLRNTISQMSLESLRSFDTYTHNGSVISDVSRFHCELKNPQYQLAYGNIDGLRQYYFNNYSNKTYALISQDLQSYAEFIFNDNNYSI